ncbi:MULTISPECIES: Rv3654c family TadE-like protein [Thermocrispum]|jgi:secretion/DNA translocation related TadE-like protein|uniref:Flp pilus-assembly TadE/G-like family protein n=1 Tax=Thermocrispum agreste TaxID=37925 RepID=A0A2W4LLI6_9PSEU|nr:MULTISPECIES: Rv3654c family TadE-like protein [Thermocrispum]PZM96576.1 MAG: helicase [Thermocrispum agreste]
MLRSRREGDEGVATVWAAAAVVAVLLVFSAVMWLGAAVITRHRVTGAADLAALAAATYAHTGEAGACARARRIAELMGAELTTCRLRGWDALVRVGKDPPGPLSVFGRAFAAARAGPIDSVGERSTNGRGSEIQSGRTVIRRR